jgi:hypothetical protein
MISEDEPHLGGSGVRMGIVTRRNGDLVADVNGTSASLITLR